MSRTAAFLCLFGTNGTGKSTFLIKCLKINKRNLIIPANSIDKAWKDFKKIKPKLVWVKDPNDFKQKRMRRVWQLPELNTFEGTRVLDFSAVNNDAERIEMFEMICRTSSGIRGCGFFIDDFKNWIKTKGTLPFYLRQLFGDRRHREIDIFIATHSYQEFNADFIQFEPNMIMFRVTLPPNKTVEGKIKNYDKFMAAFNRVLEKSKQNPYYYEGFKPS